MKIFSIDSSNSTPSISLYDSEEKQVLASETMELKSSSLMPRIQDLFQSASLKPQEIDLLCCNLGPGSFTGIRMAVTIIKTMAAELDLKVFVTNNFELIRFENGLKPDEAIAIKAGKNDYFISLDSNWHNLETNFYATELVFYKLYEFQVVNISELVIKKYLDDSNRNIVGYKELEPYYLREPSIGVKK